MAKLETKFVSCNASPWVRRLLWHTFSADTQRLERPDTHAASEKPGAHLFWVCGGEGVLEAGGKRYLLKPENKVWLVDMTKPRSYSPAPGKTLVKRGFRFGGPGLPMWLEQLGASTDAGFAVHDIRTFEDRYRRIFQLVVRRSPHWEWQMHLIYSEMMGELLESRGLLTGARTELPEPIIRVLNAIAASPLRDWSVKDLARIAGVSLSGLRRMVAAHMHEPLHSLIQRHRLDQARLLLADTRLSIKEVALRLEFSSEFYFSHFFKRLEGLSPGEYRKQLMERRQSDRHAV